MIYSAPDTTKRSRTHEVGGLATNWREFYTNPASKKHGQLAIATSGQVIVVKKEVESSELATATEAEGPGRDKGAVKKTSVKSQVRRVVDRRYCEAGTDTSVEGSNYPRGGIEGSKRKEDRSQRAWEEDGIQES